MNILDPFANFAFGIVQTAPSPALSGVTFSVQSGNGARFVTGCNIVICSPTSRPLSSTAEIARLTGKATDLFTVTRNQEGGSARAIAVGDLVFQSLTKKTLEDIDAFIFALQTAMALQHNSDGSHKWDGWNKETLTVTRTGNHTFTLPGDVTARYKKGTRFKYNDGAQDYGVVMSDSTFAAGVTTVLLAPNSDYAMAAGTITSPSYSYVNPPDYPTWFTCTVRTFTGTASMTFSTVTTNYARFKIDGKHLTLRAGCLGTTGGVAGIGLVMDVPVDIADSYADTLLGAAISFDGGGTDAVAFCYKYTSSNLVVYKSPIANFGLGAVRGFRIDVEYEI